MLAILFPPQDWCPESKTIAQSALRSSLPKFQLI
jgi:hypothetical protein